jgi:hypothetical protein
MKKSYVCRIFICNFVKKAVDDRSYICNGASSEIQIGDEIVSDDLKARLLRNVEYVGADGLAKEAVEHINQLEHRNFILREYYEATKSDAPKGTYAERVNRIFRATKNVEEMIKTIEDEFL